MPRSKLPKTTPKTRLMPADLKRCQAEMRPGSGFSLGPPGEWVRCSKRPKYVATEKEPDKNGLIGSMSMCEKCSDVFLRRYPNKAVLTTIRRKRE